MDLIFSILGILFWIFVVNAGGRFIKKLMNGGQEEGKTIKPPVGQDAMPKAEDVFKELRRKLEEAQRQTESQKEIQRKPLSPVTKNLDAPEKQEVYKQKEVISAKEKRSSEEFQKALAQAKSKEHDAEGSRLGRKTASVSEIEEEYPEFEMDLRNAMIGSIILERPYS